MMPKIKLIAIDIDGTLLDSNAELRSEVSSAVKKAINKKINVVLASGRMVSAAKRILDKLEIYLPMIALNGCFVGWSDDHKKPIYHEAIPRKTAMQIVGSAWEIDATSVFICCDKAHVRNIMDFTGRALSSWVANISALENANVIDGLEPSAILVAGEKDIVVEFDESTRQKGFNDIDQFFFPSIRYYPMHYLEFRAHGTNKGKGLAMLAKNLGVAKDSILAIGDFLNDISMKDSAGIFAVPKSADPRAIEVADYVSPFSNDECAVAEILETIIFKESF